MDDTPTKPASALEHWLTATAVAVVGLVFLMVFFHFRMIWAFLVAVALFVLVGWYLGLFGSSGPAASAAPMQPPAPPVAPHPVPVSPSAPAAKVEAAPAAVPVLTPSAMVAQMTPAQTAWVNEGAAAWNSAIDKKMTASAEPAALPEVAVPAVAAAASKPEGLAAARGGKADDLKIIKGIGPKLEALLHTLGFFHFDQLAAWTAAELAWVDDNLDGFKGRALREDWVGQARALLGRNGKA